MVQYSVIVDEENMVNGDELHFDNLGVIDIQGGETMI
jgi:hypothetical protein